MKYNNFFLVLGLPSTTCEYSTKYLLKSFYHLEPMIT